MSSDNATQDTGMRRMKRVLFGIGGVFVVIGIVRQWPVWGKSYREFIEGDGYLALMLGLIVIVLGFSVRLFTGGES